MSEILGVAVAAAALAYREAAPLTRTSPMEAALLAAAPLIVTAHLRAEARVLTAEAEMYDGALRAGYLAAASALDARAADLVGGAA